MRLKSDKSVLSSNDCKKIVKNYSQADNFDVVDYSVRPFSTDVNGFLGSHLLITIKISKEGAAEELRFFGKQFPFQQDLQKAYALQVGAYTNEIFTYEILFNEFKKLEGFDAEFAPKYYHGKDNELLVFEDLSEKGFSLPEHPNALSLEEIKFSLKVLAQFHSGSVGYQIIKSKELGRKYKLIDEFPNCMQEPLFRKDERFLGYDWFKSRFGAITALIDLLPSAALEGISKADFKKNLRQLAEDALEIIKPKDDFLNVVCHGDLWAKNVMFCYKNGVPIDCKIIDFQLLRYAPPAHDVLQLIFLTTSTQRRQHHLHELLRYYYDCLKAALQKYCLDLDHVLTYTNFESSINYLLPQIKLQTAFYYSFQGANPEFYKTITSNLEEFKKFVFGDATRFSVDLFKGDEGYKKLMTEILTELKDLILTPRMLLEDVFEIVQSKLRTTDYELLGYEMAPLGRISGFLGDHFKLKVKVGVGEEEKVLDLFAKCAPVNSTRYKFVLDNKAFIKESFFLKTLLPLMEANGIDVAEFKVPCHLIRMNKVIVFDDLEFANYAAANQREAFSCEELKVVLNKLAIYHAANIILEERMTAKTGKTFRLSSFENEVEESFFRTTNLNNSTRSIKLGFDSAPFQIDYFFQDEDNGEFHEKYLKAYDAAYELIKESKEFRNVVCHGDLWASNIMMKYEDSRPIDCLLIDYQLVRYCPPAHDLLFVIYHTTNRRTRAEFKNELIDFYYEKFAESLRMYGCKAEEIYTYEEFLKSVDHMTPQAVCQTVINYHFVMGDSDLITHYVQDEESSHKIFMEDRRDYLKDLCEKDPIYRERVKESIEDLRDMCFKYF